MSAEQPRRGCSGVLRKQKITGNVGWKKENWLEKKKITGNVGQRKENIRKIYEKQMTVKDTSPTHSRRQQ